MELLVIYWSGDQPFMLQRSTHTDSFFLLVYSVGFKEIASEWNVSVNTVARTNADLAMALGWFTLLQGSLAIKLGRRPIFLFASACQFFTCMFRHCLLSLCVWIHPLSSSGIWSARYQDPISVLFLSFIHKNVDLTVWDHSLVLASFKALEWPLMKH